MDECLAEEITELPPTFGPEGDARLNPAHAAERAAKAQPKQQMPNAQKRTANRVGHTWPTPWKCRMEDGPNRRSKTNRNECPKNRTDDGPISKNEANRKVRQFAARTRLTKKVKRTDAVGSA